MKTQNRSVTSVLNPIANGIGILVLVLALTFGVFGSDHSRVTLVSCVLAAAGFGLMALDAKLRLSASRIDALEEELRSMRNRMVADEVQSVRSQNG